MVVDHDKRHSVSEKDDQIAVAAGKHAITVAYFEATVNEVLRVYYSGPGIEKKPIPADVLVIGLCLGKPKRSIRYGLICSFFSVLGGTIAFSLGLAIGGERVVQFFEQISFGPIHLGDKAHQALELYQAYDFWAIAISALTPVPYMLFSWVGGMAEVSLLKFVGISLVFRTMRFGGEALLFYFLGEKARRC